MESHLRKQTIFLSEDKLVNEDFIYKWCWKQSCHINLLQGLGYAHCLHMQTYERNSEKPPDVFLCPAGSSKTLVKCYESMQAETATQKPTVLSA